MRWFRTWGRTLPALALSSALTFGSGAASQETRPVPVLGTFSFDDFGKASGVPIVGAVHAVVRMPNSTGMYYSVGARSGYGVTEFGSTHLSPGFFPYKASDAAQVKLVDSANLTAYKPLAVERGLVSDVRAVRTPTEELTVLYAVFPALPAEVTTVDLQFEFGSIVTGVPVSTQPLVPTHTQETTALGHGWPAFPSDSLISQADPAAVTFPLISRTQDLEGITSTEQSSEQIEVSLESDFFFEPGSSVLASESASSILDLAAKIADSGSGQVSIVGHTDSVPDKLVGNSALSSNRASAVAEALTQHLGTEFSISTEGKADSEPVDSNSTEAGRAKNRRVTVTFEVK